nr:hypothetical protein [Staphylococcus epidermidis]
MTFVWYIVCIWFALYIRYRTIYWLI